MIENAPEAEVTISEAAAAVDAVEIPHIRIQPSRGWIAIDLPELWRYRDLLFFLAWRDISVRYKQTVLGAAWAIIQPLFTMVVFGPLLYRRQARMLPPIGIK